MINNFLAELEKIQYFKVGKCYDDFEILSAHNPLNYISLTLPTEVNGANNVHCHSSGSPASQITKISP